MNNINEKTVFFTPRAKQAMDAIDEGKGSPYHMRQLVRQASPISIGAAQLICSDELDERNFFLLSADERVVMALRASYREDGHTLERVHVVDINR